MTEKPHREDSAGEDASRLFDRRPYRRILVLAVVCISAVAIVPLLVMSRISYRQYREAFNTELTRPMVRFVTAGKHSIEAFLAERQSALELVFRDRSLEELQAPGTLDTLLVGMQESFGGIVDLGLVDARGVQTSYVGPYALEGVSYAGEDWLEEAWSHGSHVSDVLTGQRGTPHIVVAARHGGPLGPPFVVRATFSTEEFHFLVRARSPSYPDQGPECRRCHALGVQAVDDAFLINREGTLQTPSRSYGEVLTRAPLPALPASEEVELLELVDDLGSPLIVSYAQIERTPFTLVLQSPRVEMHAGWRALRRDLLLFPAVSSLLILAVVFWGASFSVRRVKEADRKRAVLYHEIEYSDKMAAIGRLGSGVAHEINNPLSIIVEKSGLLRDLLTLSDEPPSKDKILGLVDSVIASAERCGGITHRLLGFAKHMYVGRETIHLDALLNEVLSFLEKEASYRDLKVSFDYPEHPPTVVSDRGQLQQVFLNIFNNALAAVQDGGHIAVGIQAVADDRVAVSISDDGEGIPESQLKHIFDPFFTTKGPTGTGLGLSITYGIVKKLEGEIEVESEVGRGTRFTVTLPTS